ncbi:DEAD/DEAH box helicase [Desulfovibrio inopinatus]|uniref:DEAD/DEAH box helicase n=1 Tax=Desulfovibrio inopinatus TaxID=102109 RepID=UPI0012EB790D|nr:DEAD/DEAH box helicase [Desulfovibrio inopinatus]
MTASILGNMKPGMADITLPDLPPWANSLKDQFAFETQMRGVTYFKAGKVTLLRADDESIDAVVKGTQPYIVKVVHGNSNAVGRNDDLHVSCSCPHFARGYLCKHLFATLLAAGENKAIQTSPRTRSTRRGETQDWRKLLRLPSEPTASSDIAFSNSGGDWKISYLLDFEWQQVSVTAVKQRILKNGQPGKQMSRVLANILDSDELPEVDRRVLEALVHIQHVSALKRRDYWGARNRNVGLHDLLIDRLTARTLFPDLAATGRCCFRAHGRRIADPLRLGSPMEAEITYEVDAASVTPGSKHLEYIPMIQLADEIIPFEQIKHRFLGRPLYLVYNERLYSLADVDSTWGQAMQDAGYRVRVPKTEVKELYMAGIEQQGPALPVPEEFAPVLLDMPPPAPCLEIDPPHVGEAISASMFFDYAGKEIDARDTRSALLDVDSWTRIERQPEEEALLTERLLQIGATAEETGFTVPGDSLFEALEALAPLMEAGWRVRGRDQRVFAPKGTCAVRIASSGMDWFDLEGDVTFGDLIIPLPKAIRVWLRGETTITLDDGRVGVLPKGWFDQYASRLGLGRSMRETAEGGDRLRFHNAHALLLDDLLDQADQSRVGMDFSDFRRRMHAFAGIDPPEPPTLFHGTLRSYQRDALGWFDFLASFGFGGVLADDMGLGKTVSALAWLALLKERHPQSTPGPSLVVAPTSLVFHWQDEARRFCLALRVLPYIGKNRAALIEAIPEHDLVVTTYGLLRRDIAMLRDIDWTLVLLDESQAIKNPSAQTAKAARVLHAKHRVCMTGTPLENRLDELWSQLHFLNPDLLGSRKSFDERFSKPVSEGQEGAKSVLQALVKPFMLRRTKNSVAADLPEKQESVIVCEPTPAQAKVYAKLRKHYRNEILRTVDANGLARSKIKVIEGLLRLRQAACHPALVGEAEAGSGKLDTMIERLVEVVSEGHKALVFSQFTKFLSLIQERLDAVGLIYTRLDGRTSVAKRKERVESFQDASGPPVFLISLKAGGVGLNLTAADYVFIMDPWWNPAAEAQAMDRAHRIGQTKTVFAYKLICKDTIDEQVLKLQDAKKDLARIIEHGTTSTIASLTREDLDALFS